MSNPQPNLLIIHTDQQSWWTLGCYGGKVVDTPNIDALAEGGAMLENFFTNSAVCTPSRGCFVTGRYPESHGAYINNVPLNRDEITFAEILRREGYRTGYAGKWHLDGKPRPGWVHPERTMGFDEAYYMFNRGHWKKMEDNSMRDVEPTVYPYDVIGDEATYTTDWLTGKAIDFLETGDDRPFCYMLSLPDPHFPVEVRAPYDTMFKPEDMELPSTHNLEHMPDWAEFHNGRSPFGRTVENREDKIRRFLALYYGEVKLIDDCVGRIVDTLKDQGLLENTLVVFTTDHGEYGGEHGLLGKNQIYETAYRIPMILHWPEGIQSDRRIENVLSTVDFQPTILEFMGVENCGREQGRSGASLIRGETVPWHDFAFFHHCGQNFAGIFTREYELALVRNGENVLFDRVNDPDQTNNLYEDPDYREIVDGLSEKIVIHHTSLGTPAAKWLNASIA